MTEHLWFRRRGERLAHAFSGGPGWRRSACGHLHWSVLLLGPIAHPPHPCVACRLAVTTGTAAGPAMTEAEAREAFPA